MHWRDRSQNGRDQDRFDFLSLQFRLFLRCQLFEESFSVLLCDPALILCRRVPDEDRLGLNDSQGCILAKRKNLRNPEGDA